MRLRLRQPPRLRPLPLNQLAQTLARPQSRYTETLAHPQTHVATLATPGADSPAALCSVLVPAVTPHGEALDALQLADAVDGDDAAEDCAPGGDAPEAEVGFFDEVLEVHAVEGGDEGSGGEGEGEDGEAEVE